MLPEFQKALEYAERYRSLGYNALPSKMHVKGPMLHTFAEFWDKPLPQSVYDEWQTSNIQLMTGVRWKLCVVDCDGDEAIRVWSEMLRLNSPDGLPPTPIVRTGGGGMHTYFTLPDWADDCPSRRLWGVWDTWAGSKHQGDWMKHREIRILGDKALAIAPPSIHVETGRPYEFLGSHSFGAGQRPAMAPGWLLRMPAIVNPRTTEEFAPLAVQRPPRTPSAPGTFATREDVIAAIPAAEKVEIAKSWGLRFASRGPNTKGWWSCHALDRDDKNPSASFHEESGVYSEAREQISHSFFDLAVQLRAYGTWEEAKNDLAGHYLARRNK